MFPVVYHTPSAEEERFLSIIAAHRGTLVSFEYSVHARLERCDPGSDYRETRPTAPRMLDITLGEGHILESIEAALAEMNEGDVRTVEVAGTDAPDIAHELSVEVWDTLIFNLRVTAKTPVPTSEADINALLDSARVPFTDLGVVSRVQKGPIVVEKTFDTENAKRIGQEHTQLQAALDHFSSRPGMPGVSGDAAPVQHESASSGHRVASMKLSRAGRDGRMKAYHVMPSKTGGISVADAILRAIKLHCSIVVALCPIVESADSFDLPGATKDEISNLSWSATDDFASFRKDDVQAWRCSYKLSGYSESQSIAVFHLGSWTAGLSPQIRVWDALRNQIARWVSTEKQDVHNVAISLHINTDICCRCLEAKIPTSQHDILIIEAPLHLASESPTEVSGTSHNDAKCKGIGCSQARSTDGPTDNVISLRSYSIKERDRSKKDKARSLGIWGRASTLIAADMCADRLSEWNRYRAEAEDVAHDVSVASIFWNLNTCLPSISDDALISDYCNKCVRRALVPTQSQYKFVFKSLCTTAIKLK